MDEVTHLKTEIQRLRQHVEDLAKENTILRQKIDALARRLFGRKSEQLNSAQLELLLGALTQESGTEENSNSEEEEPPASPTPPKTRRKNNRRIRTPEGLEVVEEKILPPEVEANPLLWKEIGQEVLDQLDYEPGKFFWRRIIRPKFVHRQEREQAPVMAKAPAKIIERGLAAPGLLAQILIGKYADHLPYYRQQEIYRQRHDVWIPRQQMVQWTEECVRSLAGIWERMRAQVLEAKYLQIDETPIRYLDSERPGGSGKGYFWTYLQPGVQVVYDWDPSRGVECLESFLGDRYSGKIQCDGYASYGAYARGRTEIELFGCWSHTRRKFYEAKEENPRMAGWFLNQIGHLYHWEKDLRESRAGPALREAVRQSKSRMVMERIGRVLEKFKNRYLPGSLMGKAVSYARNQWNQLIKVLDHGEVELDTNQVENAIRPTAIGKKNFLFIGHKEAGQRSAVVYSLIQSCRILGIEPYGYLKAVLERLPRLTNQTVEELTPLRWAEANRRKISGRRAKISY